MAAGTSVKAIIHKVLWYSLFLIWSERLSWKKIKNPPRLIIISSYTPGYYGEVMNHYFHAVSSCVPVFLWGVETLGGLVLQSPAEACAAHEGASHREQDVNGGEERPQDSQEFASQLYLQMGTKQRWAEKLQLLNVSRFVCTVCVCEFFFFF